MLQEGFARPPQSPLDRLRSLIGDTLRNTPADDTLQNQLLRGGRIPHRLDEHDSGRTLYATAEMSKAVDFAVYMSPHGGELAGDVHAALEALGHKHAPRFAGARPVLLVIDTPEESILQQGGRRLELGPALATIEGYEQYIVDNKQSRIVSVTFAAKEGGGKWSFAGQPALSPQAALQEIAPAFKGRQHFRGDPEKTKILEEIFTAQDIPGADIRNRKSGIVTQLAFTDAEGRKTRVLVPDPDFKAAMPHYTAMGFPGFEAQYQLPHGLTPKEIDAYLNVSMVKDLRGDIAPDEHMRRLQDLAAKMQADNPSLKTLKFSADDPEALNTFIRGVAHGFKPLDIQHQLSPRLPDARNDRLPFIAGLVDEFRVSPATHAAISRQMDARADAKQAELARKSPAP